jgi:azurin
MSAHTSTHKTDSSTLGTVLNIAVGGSLTLFAAYWGIALLVGSLQQSFGTAVAIEQVATPAPSGPSEPAAAAPAAAPAAAAEAGAAFELTIKPAGAAGMEYDTKSFSVKAGQKVKITFENTHPIPQPHNIVFGKPGTKDKVMMAAMQMAASPDGMTKGYIPEGDDVLFHTKLLQPTQTEVLEFAAPAEAGQYPYLCTFPGHGMLMNGIMTVE